MTRRLLAVLLALAALPGCSSDSDVGPLGAPSGTSTSCAPFSGLGPVVLGDEALENSGDRPVVVERVRLVAPAGLALTGAFLLPIARTTLLGSTDRPERSATWARRVPAEGASVPARGTRNLALQVSRSAPRASLRAVEVAYRAGRHRYVRRLDHTWQLLAEGTCS